MLHKSCQEILNNYRCIEAIFFNHFCFLTRVSLLLLSICTQPQRIRAPVAHIFCLNLPFLTPSDPRIRLDREWIRSAEKVKQPQRPINQLLVVLVIVFFFSFQRCPPRRRGSFIKQSALNYALWYGGLSIRSQRKWFSLRGRFSRALFSRSVANRLQVVSRWLSCLLGTDIRRLDTRLPQEKNMS
ncbi:hypothetical protein AVEN_233573-1 [Araneus ventricosus]|uniref:Uncharacterized protein n=1 Tax=Araneus ventricosus TaxID=182803 RepID=A0A4Y2HQ52_ARAVE|nr:hypothetical protein AVEN_233573-1 [Araneus ventricosus]